MRFTKSIHVKMEPEVWKILQKMADVRKIPLSQLIREALDLYCVAMSKKRKG